MPTTNISSRGKDRKTSTSLRAEYSGLINADSGLVEARRWIERLTFTKFKSDDFRESLADGVLLCELVVNVASMSIGRINRSSTQYAGTDNIKLFRRACETLGFDKSQLFDVEDLQEVSVKRGQSILDRAKESQQRLRKVALTVYYLGQYANENLNCTGSSALKEECFEHLLDNNLPELPLLEGAEVGRRYSQYEPSQAPLPEAITPEKDNKENCEIVTETGNFSAKRNTFKQLEEESIKDPIKSRRERIENSSVINTSPPKHQVTMKSPVDLQQKKSKFEEMERTASEESEVLQGKRTRPKSWVGSDYRSRSGSLKDKANKFEHLQKQADKQTLVLQGRRDEVDSDFTYDIGDKVNGPITLPGAADPKLQDKKKQFERLDYKAQRESTILRLHSGKSFDDPDQNPIPLNTASRRADPKPRPKSNIFDYQRFPQAEVDRREILNEPVKPKEMDFSESTPDQWNSFDDRGSSKSVSPTPAAPPRGDSLRYNSKQPQENIGKSSKTPLYSSFASQQDDSKEKGGTKKSEMKYKEFISYPVVKQRDRVDRYNAAVQELSKEPQRKPTVTGQRPRKKSMGEDEWIKHKALEEPDIDLPKKSIKKIWDREPAGDEEEPSKPIEPVDTSFDERKISTHVPNVQNMRYRDFSAAPKNLAKDRVVSRAPVVELVSTRKKSENRNEPFSNFAAQQENVEDAKSPSKKQSMSYRDFVVPPPKVESKADAAAKAQKVKEMTRKFQEIEAEQNKPKAAGPPGLKSLVDRDELVRYERESRARSWYGVDDEEFEGATRRRVRRWSDYEYEEGDKMRDAPSDMQNGDDQTPHAHPSVFDEPEPYRKPVEPETVKVQETQPVQKGKEWFDLRPPPPVPQESEIKPDVSKPVKSILRHDPVNYYEPPRQEPPPPEPPQPEPIRQEPPRPEPPRPEPAQQEPPRPEQPYEEYKPTEPEQYNRVQPRSTVGGRSWNDFESARRKKSMELLESRPTAKPYEQRDASRVPSEPYKLKRPTDYLPKQQRDQAPKTTKPPVYQQPEPQETPQYHYEVKQDHERPITDSMPRAFPTYYEPDANAGYSPVVVETGKPLFVNAKLHDKEEESQIRKSSSSSPGYDIPVDVKPEIEPVVESEPHNFKEQQQLWEYKTNQIHEQPPVQPESKTVQDDQHQVHKYIIEPEHVKQRHEEPQKPKRPQVFAIVGHAHPVRPSSAEPAKDVPQNSFEHSPKDLSPEIVKQTEQRTQPSKPKLTRSASGAKIFDFNEENDDHNEQDTHPVPPPVLKKNQENKVVLETVNVVEKGRALDDDIFKSLDEEEDKIKRNLQDPVYREKLRKEVEEETRKQREETRYLTNLQMGQPLGPNEDNFIHEEEERLRQEKLESVPQKKEIYDYNANRTDHPIIEKQINGLQHSPVEKDMPRYPDQRPREDGTRQYEPPHRDERSGRPLRHDDQGRPENRGRSPHRRPSRERERHDNERRRSPQRGTSSERERYEQERRGRSPHRRQSTDRNRHDQERRRSPRRGPSSERERYEQDRRGRSPHRYSNSERERYEQDRRGRSPQRYPSSERDRYDQDRRGRSPHRNRDDRYRENERRDREPVERRRESRDRYGYERNEAERRDVERKEQERRQVERREAERREAEREHERKEQERRQAERREYERQEQERIEHERREHARREAERLEKERIEQERIQAERLERERIEQERREHERREAERLERERIEQERREHERREAERLEKERIEQERIEQERIQAERLERERIEQERREHERREAERLERERIEQERKEAERREYERREQERIERERIEKERKEQERIAIEQERLEIERREREEQLHRERLEEERMEQERLHRERIERERIEQERIERERREQELRERDRIEHDRREQERIEWERQQRMKQERYDHERLEDERRMRDHGREQYERERQERDRYERDRQDPRYRGRYPSDHYEDRRRNPRDRRQEERYEQERREQQRREKHRREHEQFGPEEQERHRMEQQQHVHEMIVQQQQEEVEQEQYKEMLSKEQHYLYGASEKRRNSEDEGMWKKIEDGSGYDIYSTFVEDERSQIVCCSCGMSIIRDRAMYVRELNKYWHETCFRCVVCHVIFGSHEQRSPLKVTDSLLHCENCFITNEGNICTEV